MARKGASKIEKFIDRLYSKSIDRYPTKEEEEAFLSVIAEKGVEEAVVDFYNSDLFESYSSEDFVKSLFYGIMDKEPDEEKFNFWLKKMAIRSKTGVIKGFFLSDEWHDLCDKYGIEA